MDELPIFHRVVDEEGESWFVAKDVCDILELGNSREALARLDEDEKNTVSLNDGTPGNPNLAIINESGLYSLILRSDKPEAKLFKRWVTHDVLPSVRKHGAYMIPEAIEAVSCGKFSSFIPSLFSPLIIASKFNHQ